VEENFYFTKGKYHCWCKACLYEYKQERYGSHYSRLSPESQERWRIRSQEHYKRFTATDEGKRITLEKQRAYRKRRPEVGKASFQKRRSAKLRSTEHFTPAEWLTLCDKHDNQCLCCGRNDLKLTADHVIPLSRGGSNGIHNIQPLCQSCNGRKGTKTVDYRY
jgi:5-methylcytosine-specific restriction endonuclease McrA